jgi:hypothetical protein
MKYVSALLTAASGKVRGLVASHNKGGTYFRGKTIPTNPNTSFQQAARTRVSFLMARFRSVLTAVQKTSWAVFAENVNVIDRLGNSVLLTATNWYVKSNAMRNQIGIALVDAASTTFALSTLSPLTGSVTASSTNLTLGWSNVDDWQGNSTTGAVAIYASRPQNTTINYYTGPYQFAGAIKSTAGSGTVLIALPFVAGTSGTKIFVKAVATAPDGRPSSPFRLGVSVP